MTISRETIREFRLKLYVSDLAERRRFYEDTIGWPILKDWGSGVMYQAGPAIFELLNQLNSEPHNSSCDVSLEVPDVHALWHRLSECTFVVFALRENSWGDTSFCIADPGGFRLTFFSPTEK